MKLINVNVENFRGISNASIKIDNFTTLVGGNNIGKSTILCAIKILLDNLKPTRDDWPAHQPSDEVMRITCEFGDIQPWERLKPAISTLLNGDLLQVKMEAIWTDADKKPECSYFVNHKITVTPFNNKGITDAKKDPELAGILSHLNINNAAEYKARMNELESYLKDNRADLISEVLDWHEKVFANSLQQAIPHVMYVPASFKIEDELKTTASSPFAYLFMNKLFPKVKADITYTNYIERAALLQNKLKGKSDDGSEIEGLGSALDSISTTLNSILDFDSKVRLSIGDIDIEPHFMKAATFLIEEEMETSLQYQGSGVQRALAFAMLECNASVEASVTGATRTTIVLYEEPELYIHPHLMRRLKNTLQSRSELVEWQVICSTHSPFLIDLANKPQSIKLLKRGVGNSRKVSQLPSNIFEESPDYDERVRLRAVLDFHPSVCESLFAKRVVIVEGDTEVAIFSLGAELVKKYEIEHSQHLDTTVISAGGKWTIPAIVKVLNELDIEYKVIHDTDRKGLSDEDLIVAHHLHPYKANEKINSVAKEGTVFLVNDTFEHVLWDKLLEEKDIKSSGKPYNSWKRVRDYLDGTLELRPSCEVALKKL
ncbi:ATP-dependent nuclease [Shewanella oncorhynchi]|uniref:ATP-dependent nuclease n=1 Tax=Shewanella oncorhynchi TaxID=2726434 RepID=UPI003D7A75D6